MIDIEGGTRDRIRALLESDPVAEVRADGVRAFSVIAGADSGTVESLVAMLDDPDDVVRRTATLALGRVRHPRAAEALAEILESRPDLWQEASAALAGAAERDMLGRLVPLLDSPVSEVRRGALRAIAALSSPAPATDGRPLFVYSDDHGHWHPLF